MSDNNIHLQSNIEQRRQELKRITKIAIASAVIPLATFSAPAHAVWLEIARGIAKGIANYIDQMYRTMGEWWKDAQTLANQKAVIAEARAEDSVIDFRIQTENLRRVNKIKPTSSLCDQEYVSVEHHTRIEEDLKKEGLTNTSSSLVMGSERADSVNLGMRYLSNSNMVEFKPSDAVRSLGKVEAKLLSNERLTAEEAVALSKTTMGTTAALAMQPIRSVAKTTADTSKLNGQQKYQLKEAMFNTGIMSYSASLYMQSLPVEPSETLKTPTAKKTAIQIIQSRFANDEWQKELTVEMNEVALGAEYTKMIGERIYMLNQMYQQNEKMIAAMAMQILQNARIRS